MHIAICVTLCGVTVAQNFRVSAYLLCLCEYVFIIVCIFVCVVCMYACVYMTNINTVKLRTIGLYKPYSKSVLLMLML